jgi:hypothetical protein
MQLSAENCFMVRELWYGTLPLCKVHDFFFHKSGLFFFTQPWCLDRTSKWYFQLTILPSIMNTPLMSKKTFINAFICNMLILAFFILCASIASLFLSELLQFHLKFRMGELLDFHPRHESGRITQHGQHSNRAQRQTSWYTETSPILMDSRSFMVD